MNKLSINLLPQEMIGVKKAHQKKNLIIRIGASILVIILMATSLVLASRIYQNQRLKNSEQQLAQAQNQVASLKDQESLVFFLKQRLDAIRPILDQDSKQAQSYNLISALTPSSVKILFLTSDKNGNVVVTVVAPDSSSVRNFFDNLVDPSINQGKISKVQLDSLTRAADNLYRMDLTINII